MGSMSGANSLPEKAEDSTRTPREAGGTRKEGVCKLWAGSGAPEGVVKSRVTHLSLEWQDFQRRAWETGVSQQAGEQSATMRTRMQPGMSSLSAPAPHRASLPPSPALPPLWPPHLCFLYPP